ncbi:uncharacterized protein [Montipora capricornis]|uniref:uncharacterized protein n=1 Tax=Montipora capricornis TaxID=246305 RepID=UPI0035F121C7
MRSLEMMQDSVKFSSGHYEIALPWKNEPPQLVNNRYQAEHRLQMLKKRLQREATQHEKYKQFMADLLSKNYAREINKEETADAWYLPHHPVFHPQKPDKVRVVFDCSAKYRGSSLNDQLLQGPDLTSTLVGVLKRFRQDCANYALKKTAEDHKGEFDEAAIDTRERALGVQWKVKEDTFSYTISHKEKPATRRGILSIVSSIYDPLGFVSPCILPAKQILQELCLKGLSWDYKIPECHKQGWRVWLQELPKLERFEIPRCFKPPNFTDVKRRELHQFSDASSRGYGAVSYLRQIDINGKFHCSLVMAKSRLTPLKAMTILRMELSAAVLPTRLDNIIKQELDLPLDGSTFWTDSTCVLRYIENKDKRFQTFVANRISAILDQSAAMQWRYVDTLISIQRGDGRRTLK